MSYAYRRAHRFGTASPKHHRLADPFHDKYEFAHLSALPTFTPASKTNIKADFYEIFVDIRSDYSRFDDSRRNDFSNDSS